MCKFPHFENRYITKYHEKTEDNRQQCFKISLISLITLLQTHTSCPWNVATCYLYEFIHKKLWFRVSVIFNPWKKNGLKGTTLHVIVDVKHLIKLHSDFMTPWMCKRSFQTLWDFQDLQTCKPGVTSCPTFYLLQLLIKKKLPQWRNI